VDQTNKKIFISYSHSDREFAERLAKSLHEAGEDVWWDRWEIQAGDSLIKKIFEEGLSKATAFVVVISPESVKSKWVRQELDVATIKRIEGVTKIIPVVIGNTEVPIALRALLRIDVHNNLDEVVQKIVNSVHEISGKPKQPTRESIASTLTENVAGLSKAASTVGFFIVRSGDADSGQVQAFSATDLSMALKMDPETINDAVDELEESGMVRTLKELGTAPYQFVQLEATYVLYREFSGYLDYNPEEDIRITAATIASAGEIKNEELAKKTGLSPGRLNRAVAYLADYNLVDRIQTLGTFPYTFYHLSATRRTRQFVS
jgi:DNA-binding MarR family transcriptional regulator